MNDELKKIIDAHREAFNSSEPGEEVWVRIAEQLEAGDSGRGSSNRLSGPGSLGFGLSMLLLAVYFMAAYLHYLTPGSDPESQATRPSTHTAAPHQQVSAETKAVPAPYDLPDHRTNSAGHVSAALARSAPLAQDSTETIPAFAETGAEIKRGDPDAPESVAPAGNAASEKKNARTRSRKPELYIPPEPTELNSYTGTIYGRASLCALLRAYKFPGKIGVSRLRPYKLPGRVGMHLGAINDGHAGNGVSIKTLSCGRLEAMEGITGIWLKGRTDRELPLSVKKKFRNIVLVKGDGRTFYPEAISHYYDGLGVITEYSGKELKMTFKDRVELLLFFKNAEPGDRILIDGVLEAVVKAQP